MTNLIDEAIKILFEKKDPMRSIGVRHTEPKVSGHDAAMNVRRKKVVKPKGFLLRIFDKYKIKK